MPLTGIRLLFETLVQCTRELCKCEKRENGSKDCNASATEFREPHDIPRGKMCCTAKTPIRERRCWTAGGALRNPPP
jgi:hypothetical protein